MLQAVFAEDNVRKRGENQFSDTMEGMNRRRSGTLDSDNGNCFEIGARSQETSVAFMPQRAERKVGDMINQLASTTLRFPHLSLHPNYFVSSHCIDNQQQQQ